MLSLAVCFAVFVPAVTGTSKSRISSRYSLEGEKALHRDLLDGPRDKFTKYNKDVRPMLDEFQPIPVYFQMRMHKLVGLDVKKQVLRISAFTILRWNDPQLTWNPLNYNNISHINMFSDLLWTPDIVLYNTADESSYSHVELYKTKALVTNKGDVTWSAPITWKVSCEFDVTWFPVDIQKCNITFGSWSYTKSHLNLTFLEDHDKHGLKSEHFHVESGEWRIDELSHHEELLSFPCCEDEFRSVKYNITLSRISLFYFMYVIIPLIALTFLFILVFKIPHDSGERMGYGVTILLSITVYLLVISEKLPEKSDASPMLGLSFIVVFLLLCTALALACFTMNLARKTTRPPRFLRVAIGSRCTFAPNPRVVYSKAGDETVIYDEQSDERRKLSYQEEWEEISKWCDRKFFIAFLLLVLLSPCSIILSLPNNRHTK